MKAKKPIDPSIGHIQDLFSVQLLQPARMTKVTVSSTIQYLSFKDSMTGGTQDWLT